MVDLSDEITNTIPTRELVGKILGELEKFETHFLSSRFLLACWNERPDEIERDF
jgi:hypothetical protein